MVSNLEAKRRVLCGSDKIEKVYELFVYDQKVFMAVVRNEKLALLRNEDIEFRPGDDLLLRRVLVEEDKTIYTGDWCLCHVTYVDETDWTLKALSIKAVEHGLADSWKSIPVICEHLLTLDQV